MRRLITAARWAAGSLAFRAVVTLALLAIVAANVRWDTIGDRIADGRPGYGVLAVACIAAALVLAGLRWGRLLRVAGAPITPRELYRIYAMASFATAFLPSAVGGDVARPFMVSRSGPRLIRAITTVVLERAIAFVPLIGVAWLGVLLEPGATAGSPTVALAVATVGIVVAVLVLVARPALPKRLLRALLPERLARHLGEAAAAVRATLGSPRTMAIVLLQSTAFQILVTMQLVLLAKMIGVDLPFGLAAVALALVTLAMLVPVSIGGFGVREGSYAVVLAPAGIAHTDAVLISLLSVVALFIATLPGAVELIRHGFAVADDPLTTS